MSQRPTNLVALLIGLLSLLIFIPTTYAQTAQDDVLKTPMSAVVSIKTDTGSGSGFLISKDGPIASSCIFNSVQSHVNTEK